MFVINIVFYKTFSFTVFDNLLSISNDWPPAIESKSIFTTRGPIHSLQYGSYIRFATLFTSQRIALHVTKSNKTLRIQQQFMTVTTCARVVISSGSSRDVTHLCSSRLNLMYLFASFTLTCFCFRL